MSNLEKEFVPYNLALRLKALGFDEPCLAYWDDDKVFELNPEFLKGSQMDDIWLTAPTYSQTFRWFREKYKLNSEQPYLPNVDKYGIVVSDMKIKPKNLSKLENNNRSVTITDNFKRFDSKDEAEISCLKKLIEIVEKKEL